jgi:hypothetical protein
MAAARTDRILYWPTALAVACFVLLVWSGAFGLGSMYLDRPFILLYWLIAGGAGVIACIAWVCERAWRRLLSTMILPLSVLVAGFNLQSVWRVEKHVEFYLMHPGYHSAISKLPKD